MKSTAIIMYSHSDYSDIWEMFTSQVDKYFKDIKKYAFIDKDVNKILPDHWEQVYYNEEEQYDRRVQSCLVNIKEEYCIFHHEDMVLFDTPDYAKLEKCKSILEDEDISYIKLIKGGLYSDHHQDIQFNNHDGIYLLEHSTRFIFAVQPSLWRTEDLLEIYSETDIDEIHEFEVMASQVCKQLNIDGLYTYNGEKKRGMFHWDSNTYPYIATAIVKGKWNISEYEKEMTPLLEQYNIIKEDRGFV